MAVPALEHRSRGAERELLVEPDRGLVRFRGAGGHHVRNDQPGAVADPNLPAREVLPPHGGQACAGRPQDLPGDLRRRERPRCLQLSSKAIALSQVLDEGAEAVPAPSTTTRSRPVTPWSSDP